MKRLFTTVFVLLMAFATFAVPAYLGWQTKTQPDGTTIEVQQRGDEFYNFYLDRAGNQVACDADGYWRVVGERPSAETVQARRNASPKYVSRPKKAIGKLNLAPRGLVILVSYSNSRFFTSQSIIDDMMNASDYTYEGATGSVGQYFSDQSDGQYTPYFDVVGPVTLSNPVAHYGGNDNSGDDVLPGDMVVEACSIANATLDVDFSQYDNDGDGDVDFVYIIYAGKGEADGGAEHTIWPHNWNLESAYYFGNCTYSESQRRFDGKYVDNYACSGELNGSTNKLAGIGTFAHEFTHVIGLPDLYDVNYGDNYRDSRTPGNWHVMDGGSYNNEGKTPPNYSIYDKYFIGWNTPVNPGETSQEISLYAPSSDLYNGYQLATSTSLLSATSSNVVYYIENRQQTGWDEYLPGHGMLIWHVRYNARAWQDNAVNTSSGSPRYTIVSATGSTTDIGYYASDPFPGSYGVTSWYGLTGRSLTQISESGKVVSLTYTADATSSESYTYTIRVQLDDACDMDASNGLYLWWWSEQDSSVGNEFVATTWQDGWYTATITSTTRSISCLVANGNDWLDGPKQTVDFVNITGDICLEVGPAEYVYNNKYNLYETSCVTAPCYTLTIEETEGGYVQVDPTTSDCYVEGTEVTLLAIADEGYEFVAWSDGNTAMWRTIEMTQDSVLSATFRHPLTEYDVTNLNITTAKMLVTATWTSKAEWFHIIITNSSNDELINEIIYAADDNKRYTYKTPKAGSYTFSIEPLDYTYNSMGYVVTQTFVTVPEYSLYIYADYGGSVNEEVNGSYPSGTEVVIEATPNAGYRFQSWDDGDTHAKRTLIIDQDYYLMASFKRIPTYELTIYEGEHCQASMEVGSYTYEEDEVVTLTPIADEGHFFTHWIVNGRGYSDTELSLTIDQDYTVYPVAQAIKHMLVILPDAFGQTNMAPGNYEYSEGEEVTLYPVADKDFLFDYWIVNDQLVTDSLLVLVMDKDYEVKPWFKPNKVGVENIFDNITVEVHARTILVETASELDYLLYDQVGRFMGQQLNTRSASFTVPSAGLYLLRTRDGVKKIRVE